MKEEEKNQIIIVSMLIMFILICILIGYTIINTKSIDNLNNRIEKLEGTNNSGSSETTTEEVETANGYSTEGFKEILPSDIDSESKNQTIVLLWARPSCGYCVAYVPIITEVAEEHNVTIRYINMETIVDMTTYEPSNQEEYDILANLEGKGDYKDFASDAISGTPATYFIKNGKIIGGLIGYNEKTTVEQAFTEAGL